MDSFIPRGGFQLPFQRRLSRLYNDTKKSSDFVQEPVQAADDPEIKALHRKLRIQKDRLVSWGLEWSDPNQTAEIDESLSKAGLSDLVGSIMATIKDILAEAEPLWLASKRPLGSEKAPEKLSGDRKTPLIVWDKGRFEDLVKDLTASIDTLCDLSRTRSSAAVSSRGATGLSKSSASIEDLRRYGSTRIQTPQQIDPRTLTSLESMQAMRISEAGPADERPQEIFFMNKQAYAELTRRPGTQPWSPLLVEYAQFDPIYSMTGIMPEMSRFEKLSEALQTESSRSPGAWIGLPLLLGYYEDMEQSRLALIYQFPPTFNPVTFENLTQNPLDSLCTLTSLLQRPDFEPTLEAKFRLAYNLANTVFDMHARGITHGNLNGSTISFCNTVSNDPGMPDGEVDIRRPLVSSFDIFPDPSSSSEPPSTFLLHRHPLDPRTTSQSPLASNSDSKTLDLYSLAMMLVSIGLWTNLENLTPDRSSPSISESVLHQLAIRCGTPYMKAIQACWNAVDRELANPSTSDNIVSQVQMRASRYLEACCILDGISGLDDRFGEDEPPMASIPAQRAEASTASLPGPSASSSTPLGRDTKSQDAPDLPISIARGPEQVTEVKSVETEPQKAKEKTYKQRLYPQIALPTEIVDQWNTTLMPQINMALRGFYRKNPESVEISLESVGESPQKTTPTVVVVCTSVSKVRAILKKKLGILFDGTTTGLALKVCRGSVLRSRKDPTRSMAKGSGSGIPGGDRDMAEEDTEDITAANPDFQPRPLNGASIGAWIGDKHLPPVSFGGLIIVDEKPYGMTVHHMLDDPDGPCHTSKEPLKQAGEGEDSYASPYRSSAASQSMYSLHEYDSSSASSIDEYACEFSDSDSELPLTDITSDDEDDEDSDDEQFTEPGDIPGVEPGCGDGYVITQPALDDVPEGFYPSEETMDEDHLDTYSLGEVYATSGIRRREENGMVHEIDWALFEFHDDRLPDDNSIPRVASSRSQSAASLGDLQPMEVAPAKSLPGLEVQCIARTSGLQTGQIMPALTSVKIYGRISPSHTYQVSGQAAGTASASGVTSKGGVGLNKRQGHPLGVPGDSGAWVIDRLYGRVCGHILAWSERKQVAYICPMDVLLLDIAQSLEATEIRLPDGDVVVKLEAGVDEGGTEVIDISDEGSDTESWQEEGVDEVVPQLEEMRRRGKYDDTGAELDIERNSSMRRGRFGSQRSQTTRMDRGEDRLAMGLDAMHIHGARFGFGTK
ncbi:hypothetical protein F5Y15DRAFT_238518 [Xylariaceae sp. FL0016]|nr:hypothetical protein F5Y15DRAFT_238518 [Xylariaceae sp. FL0016]